MSRVVYIFIAVVMMVVATTSSVEAQNELEGGGALSKRSVDKLWDDANTAYVNYDYNEALRMYQEIEGRDLHSAELYFNMGNVYYKRDEIGKALLYYYKALRLDPSDVYIRHNIEFAQNKTTDNIEKLPRLFLAEWNEWIRTRMSSTQWVVVSLSLLALTLGFLLLYLLSDRMMNRRIGFFGLVVAAVLFIYTTNNSIYSRWEMVNHREAVVMNRALSVKSSPNGGATELFIIHEGTKVRVLNSIGGWSEIRIDDGNRGWVEDTTIARI
ncbi:MAG: SH3 domain-containing protein [Rikenellaceae bacterium]